MKAHVEPVCPFEGCGAWAVHYHRNRRAADLVVCECVDDPGHDESNTLATRCYAPRPGNAKPETDPRHAHDPWILPTREQVARVLFASTYGDDGKQWDEVTGVRHDFYLDDADAVLALLSPWRPVEPGTTIKAGTRYRVEDGAWAEEILARNDWITTSGERVYIDPRTVPAEPDPRVKAVAQVLAEKAGISLDEAEATLVVQALDRMGDDSVTYPPTTAHHMEDL